MRQFLTRRPSGISWSRLALAALCVFTVHLILTALDRAFGLGGDGLVLANTLVTPSWIMKEGMFRLTNTMKFSGEVNRN